MRLYFISGRMSVLFVLTLGFAVWAVRAQNPVPTSERFVRGTGDDPAYQSFVIPLDGQRGVALDLIGGSVSNYFVNRPWTNLLYHLDATNAANQDGVTNGRIAFENPVAVFGTRVAGTPLYVNQNYSFGAYAGDASWTGAVLTIRVFNRTNLALVQTLDTSIPQPSQTNEWTDFLTNGYTKTAQVGGLTTTLAFNGVPAAWGVGTNNALRLTHRGEAAAKAYVFEVGLNGRTARGAMVLNQSVGWVACPLYALEFDDRPAWRPRFVDDPHFDGEPMPSWYAGKAIEELESFSWPVTNQVSLPDPPSTYTNLDQSPELRQHPVLDSFVEDLGSDPIALANYVFNEIDLTDAVSFDDMDTNSSNRVNSGGVNRSALGTFLEGQGSPVEQCALLVYLLRRAGVPAIYVYPPQNGVKLLDSRLSKLLRMQLKGAVDETGHSAVPQLIPVNYPWVAAWAGAYWVHLYPWLKDTEIVEGLNLYDYMPVEYNSGYKWLRAYLYGATNILSLSSENTPATLFPKFVQQKLLETAPGISVDDIGVRVRNRRHHYARWSDFPTPTQVTNISFAVESLATITNTFPALTNIFDTVSVEITSVSEPTNKIYTGELRTLDLHNRQLVLYYQPGTGGAHQMILSLSPFRSTATNRLAFAAVNPQSMTDTNILCQLVTTNTLASAEDDLRLRVTSFRRQFDGGIHATNPVEHLDTLLGIEVTQPFSRVQTTTHERTLRKGDLVAICLNPGRVSQKMVNGHARNFWQLQQLVADDPQATNRINIENYQGTLTYLMGLTYFDRVGRFKAANERLHKVSTVSWYGVGLASLAAYRNPNGSLPTGEIRWIKPRLDIVENQIAYAANGTLRPDLGESFSYASDDFFQILLADSSAQEHETINSYFRQSGAVSTVKLLQLSETGTNSAGPGILELNIHNYKSYATNQYGGTALKDFDPQMWTSVTNAFTQTPASNFVQVFITSGWVTNATGRQMGALVLGGDYYTALISTNLNGGEGEGLPSDVFDLSEFSSLTLEASYSHSDNSWYYVDYDPLYDLDWYSKDEGYSWDYSLSYTQPSLSRPYDFPSQVSLWNFDWTLSQADQDYYQFSHWQEQSLDTYRFSMGLPSGLSDTDTIWYQRNSGDLGKTSWYRDFMKLASDPVNVMNGEFYIDTVDLTMPGAMPLEIRRSYGSHNLSDNQFGYGWKLSYFPWLVVATNEALIYAAEMDGSVVAYRLETNGLWRPRTGDNPQLNNRNGGVAGALQNMFNARLEQQIVDGGTATNYVLFGPDASRRTFRVQTYPIGSLDRTRPYLQKWEDNRGNYYQFSFGTNAPENDYGQLRSIQSSSGARAVLYYDTYGHITEIYSADGRRIRYAYGRYGDLVRVILPDASEIQYEYQSAPSTNTALNDVYGWVRGSVGDYLYFPRETVGSDQYVGSYIVQYGSYHYPPDPQCDGSYVTAYYGNTTYVSQTQDSDQHVQYFDQQGYWIDYWRSGLIHPNYSRPGLYRNSYYRYTWGYTEPDFVQPAYWIPAPYFPSQNVYVTTSGYFWRKTGTSSVDYQDYISTHLLVSETKPDGRILQNQYDEQNRVTNQLSTVGADLTPIRSGTFIFVNDYQATNRFTNTINGHTFVIDGLGNTNRYDYTNSLLTCITDPLQHSTVQDWYEPHETNKVGYCLGSLEMSKDKRSLWTKFYYDSKGSVITNIVIGDLTGNGRPAANRSEAETVAASSSIPGPGDVEKAVSAYTYRTNGTVATATDATGVTMSWFYDDTNFAYLPTRIIRSVGATPISSNQLYYTNVAQVVTNGVQVATNLSCGLLWREIRPGSTNERAFDGRGFVVKTVGYTGTSDPNVTNSFFHNSRGELVEEANALRIVRYDYDAAGRRQWQETWEPGASFPLAWERAYYNENGEIVWSDGPRFDPEDYVWRDYDGGGRLTTEIRWRSQAKEDGSGVEAVPGYDLYATTHQEYDVFANLTRIINPRGVITTNTWDAAGQLVRREVIETNGAVLLTEGYAYEAGGLVAAATNGLGGITRKFYTSLGQLKRQENPDGSINGWFYCLDGRVRREHLSNGSYWESAYDDANRKATRVFYSQLATALATNTTELDARGNVVKRTDADGNVFTNLFDGLNRLRVSAGPAILSVSENCGSVPGCGNYVTNIVQQSATNFYDAVGVWQTNVNALGEKTLTRFDPLGRVTRTEIRNAAGILVRETSTGYAQNHHGVTVTNGAGSSAVVSSVFTDNDGRTLLSITYPYANVREFTRHEYDLAGNPAFEGRYAATNSAVTFFSGTATEFDGLSRLTAQVDRDGAVTYFHRDALGNVTNRVMPGGLQWNATYNNAGQMLQEWNTGDGGAGTRNNTYTYYAAGSPFAGLLETRTEPRGLTGTYTYDKWLRLTNIVRTTGDPYARLTTIWGYDARGFATNITELNAGAIRGSDPKVVSRTFDAYGQRINESITINGVAFSSGGQSWDAAGRRSGLGIGPSYSFSWRADGLLAAATTHTGGATYGYDAAGVLTNRNVGSRATSVTARDGTGRPLAITTKVNQATKLTETLSWMGDGLLNAQTLERIGDFTDSRSYSYADLSRRLAEERLNLDATKRWTNVFSYDGGQPYGPGVLTKVGSSAAAAQWSGAVDAFSRVNTETNSSRRLSAYGRFNGQATVTASLDGQPLPVNQNGASDATWPNQWHTVMEAQPGAHQLTVSAAHPSGQFVTNATSWFTNNAAHETVSDYYSVAGMVQRRIWKKADGTINRTQILLWDAKERLYDLTEYDSQGNGFVWRADYDGLDRRLRTRWYAMTNGYAQIENPAGYVEINQYYDPQVEFLELGVNVNGKTTWKLYGPDANGMYGGMNGTGGLEAVVPEEDLFYPTIGDSRGNVLGAVTDGLVAWAAARPTGYGAVSGYRPLPLGHGGDLVQASAWRGRWADITGYYQIGLRPYDPAAGAWLSYDSVWNGRDPNYYTFAGGDPINYFDPDGRVGKVGAKTFDAVWNAVLATFGTGGDTDNRQIKENLAKMAIESPFGSPMRKWFGAYDETPGTKALVEDLPAAMTPEVQNLMMAYGATRGTVQTPVSIPARETQWGAPIDPYIYEGWRQDTQPRTINLSQPEPLQQPQQPIITVLGSGRDVAQYANQPGFNVLRIPNNIPQVHWDAYNEYWLMNAYTRGDSFWLVTDPVAFSQVLRNANKPETVSAYFRVELPILNSFNVRQNAVPAYALPGGPPAIPPQRR